IPFGFGRQRARSLPSCGDGRGQRQMTLPGILAADLDPILTVIARRLAEVRRRVPLQFLRVHRGVSMEMPGAPARLSCLGWRLAREGFRLLLAGKSDRSDKSDICPGCPTILVS